MCLFRIDQRIQPPDPTEREGWKIIMKSYIPLAERTFFETPWYGFNQPLKQWIRCESFRSIQSGSMKNEIYSAGFHIFTSIEDALKWRNVHKMMTIEIVKVRYKNLRTIGHERLNGIEVLTHVADDIFFLRELYVAPDPMAV